MYYTYYVYNIRHSFALDQKSQHWIPFNSMAEKFVRKRFESFNAVGFINFIHACGAFVTAACHRTMAKTHIYQAQRNPWRTEKESTLILLSYILSMVFISMNGETKSFRHNIKCRTAIIFTIRSALMAVINVVKADWGEKLLIFCTHFSHSIQLTFSAFSLLSREKSIHIYDNIISNNKAEHYHF